MEVHDRIELSSPTYKEGASPQCLWTVKLAPKGGIEPPTYWLTASRNYRCATWELKLFEIGATSGS